jgi:hypothetical protein
MKNQHVTAFIFSVFILFSSCKKEGPEGPAGKDGNANVKSGTITFSNWTWDSSNSYLYSNFTWTELTSSVVNGGAFYIYLNTTSGWAPLPRTIYPSPSYTQSQRYVYNVGSFKIIVQDSDLIQPASPGSWTIKVVAVDGTVRKANPDLDWNDYEEVKRRLGLED